MYKSVWRLLFLLWSKYVGMALHGHMIIHGIWWWSWHAFPWRQAWTSLPTVIASVFSLGNCPLKTPFPTVTVRIWDVSHGLNAWSLDSGGILRTMEPLGSEALECYTHPQFTSSFLCFLVSYNERSLYFMLLPSWMKPFLPQLSSLMGGDSESKEPCPPLFLSGIGL